MECKVLAHTVLVLCRIYSFLLDIYLFLVSLRNKLLFGFRGVCGLLFCVVAVAVSGDRRQSAYPLISAMTSSTM